MNHYGYIKDFQTRDNYVLGGLTKTPEIVLQPDGQWDDFLPEREIQNIDNVETANCTGFATSSVVEMLFKRKFGLQVNYSDRGLGINAGTYPPGNSPHKVSETIRSKGLFYETFLSFKDIHSVDEYYSPSPLPDVLKQKGLLWTDRYRYMHEYVKPENIKYALTLSPVCFAVYAWQQNDKGHFYKTKGQEDTHWVICYGFNDVLEVWKIYDSYDNTLKLYTYDSEIETIKRYYIEEKTPQEQLKNAQLNFLQIILQYVKNLLAKTYRVGGAIIQEVFSKRN